LRKFAFKPMSRGTDNIPPDWKKEKTTTGSPSMINFTAQNQQSFSSTRECTDPNQPIPIRNSPV